MIEDSQAPTPTERLLAIEAFVADELRQREHMIWLHPEKQHYWQARAHVARLALEHARALKEMLP